ncbi:MAG: sigma-54-dependent Fis family transcriptional regulator [Deltaproteobacteria bacterium]|jgi:two-component system response regulator FlrC|nr:sigma-54-dependent Fis family transcriptional regulator [Deltaproteobacteria bacterium]MBW2536665.1 sigma-54-dependent Fis family transcriptional regulator [Deltaproteobacteria bacterium]
MARILVVDDEASVRSFLADALETADHEVDRAGDGSEASRQLDRHSYEVVVTDLKMPGMDGMQLLERLRREQPEVEVIVLTAHGSVESAVQAMKLGAFDFLQKPLSGPDELRLLVSRAVERHRAVSAREAAARDQPPRLGYGAPTMAAVVHAIERVAPTDATVLLTGESGTGKEIAARAIHARSRRAQGPFVAVNCAALSAELLESELFGHERGAFTGADERRRGRLELAAGGSFFLDEIAELRPGLQAKLLRVLQERQFERVGGNQTITCDVRWIAATNRNLDQTMAEGAFREDLFHRLAVFPIDLPPLRERREDIGPLAEALLARIAAELGRPSLSLAAAARAALEGHDWPGNVRELENTLERAAILSEGDELSADELLLRKPAAGATASSMPTMAEAESAAIRRALDHFEGNRRKAAEHLGIGLRTLYDKLKRYGLG